MIQFFAAAERATLNAYVVRLKAGDPATEAFAATFGKRDLPALEAAWAKHHGLPSRGSAPVPAPAAPAPVPGTDLLAALEARVGSLRGWAIQDRTLISPLGGGGDALDLAYEPPEEYDWRLQLQRTTGGETIHLGLSGFGRRFLVTIDGQGQCGLSAIDDGKGVNPTLSKKRILPPGTPTVIECSVRRSGVKATANGETLFDWKGHFSRLSPPQNARIPAGAAA